MAAAGKHDNYVHMDENWRQRVRSEIDKWGAEGGRPGGSPARPVVPIACIPRFRFNGRPSFVRLSFEASVRSLGNRSMGEAPLSFEHARRPPGGVRIRKPDAGHTNAACPVSSPV